MQEDCSAMQGSKVGLIPELRRSLGGGNENLHQYSCLENPWTEGPGGLQSTVQRVAKSKRLWSQLFWV